KYAYWWDWAGAEGEFQRAIELKPSYATAHHWYSIMLAVCGRWEESHAQLARARDLDPQSLIIATYSAFRLYWQRRYEDAIKELRSVLATNPKFASAHFILGRAYAQERRFHEAIAEFEAIERVSGKAGRSSAALASVYARAGQRGKAEAILRDLTTGSAGNVSPCWIAIVYADLGDMSSAIDWLEKAREEHDGILVYIGVDQAFDPLRQEPRFQKLLEG